MFEMGACGFNWHSGMLSVWHNNMSCLYASMTAVPGFINCAIYVLNSLQKLRSCFGTCLDLRTLILHRGKLMKRKKISKMIPCSNFGKINRLLLKRLLLIW